MEAVAESVLLDLVVAEAHHSQLVLDLLELFQKVLHGVIRVIQGVPCWLIR